jgi:hypothetical protein
MTVCGERHAADDRDAESMIGEEGPNAVEFANEVHAVDSPMFR